MLGGNEIAKLNLQKQALVLESSLNRLNLLSEFEHLRSSAGLFASAGKKRAPLLLALAPIAGFFVARGVKRSPSSWFSRLATAAKYVGPAIALWRSFSAGRKKNQGSRDE